MKKSLNSFIALNRRALLFLGIVLSLTALGIIAFRTVAQNRSTDIPQKGDPAAMPAGVEPFYFLVNVDNQLISLPAVKLKFQVLSLFLPTYHH